MTVPEPHASKNRSDIDVYERSRRGGRSEQSERRGPGLSETTKSKGTCRLCSKSNKLQII